jgi:D-alanyl-D-alanine carboxypeptidase
MPLISAKSWIIYEMKQNRRLCSKRSEKKREIASLTKIMNLITILELIQTFKLDSSRIRAKVSQKISTVTGTTAELKCGA